MQERQWSASMICTKVTEAKDTISVLNSHKLDYLHIDVMDGTFVPRLGMYPELVAEFKALTQIPIEVHMMLDQPIEYIRVFADSGADIITVHFEACRDNLFRVIDEINRLGVKVGIALNPLTDWENISQYNHYIDYLLLMGINPGILNQSPFALLKNKIHKYSSIFKATQSNTKIIVDGGVTKKNANSLFDAGANVLVGGSQTIFHKEFSISENLYQLRSIQETCHATI